MKNKTDIEQEIHERVAKALGTTTAENVVLNLQVLLGYIADLGAVWPDKCKEVPDQAWINAAIYGQHAITPFLESELTKRLHENCAHPDWQYCSVEHPRKACYSNKPNGYGWIDNNELDRGVTRYDSTESHHFRRLKTDTDKDDIDLYVLPDMPSAKVIHLEYLDKLRAVFCKDYMPSSTSTRQYNSKPEYVRTASEIISLSKGNGVYAIGDGTTFKDLSAFEGLTGELQKEFFFSAQGNPNVIFAMEIHDLRILTNLQTVKSFVTTKRKDGTWQGWITWSLWLNLPIDRYTLDKILESI